MMRVLFIIQLMSCFLANGQEKSSEFYLPLVTVIGTGTASIVPDEAIMVVKVERQVSLNALSGMTDSFLFAKEDLDIKFVNEENVIQTLPEVDVSNDKAIFVKHFVVTVSEMAKIQKVMIELFKCNFTKIESIRYRTTRLDELKGKASQESIQRAISKAKTYASGLGRSLGVTYRIEELEPLVYDWYQEELPHAIDELNYGEYCLNPGAITVIVSTKVSFELVAL